MAPEDYSPLASAWPPPDGDDDDGGGDSSVHRRMVEPEPLGERRAQIEYLLTAYDGKKLLMVPPKMDADAEWMGLLEPDGEPSIPMRIATGHEPTPGIMRWTDGPFAVVDVVAALGYCCSCGC